MTQNAILPRLEQVIADLESKQEAIAALLRQYRTTYESLKGLSPEALRLLDDPERLLRATELLGLPLSETAPSPAVPDGDPAPANASTPSGDGATAQQPIPTVNPKGSDLAGRTVVECAVAILKEEKSPMHFREVADMALKRGYTLRRKDSSLKTVHRTFWSMMSRNKDVFEPVGGGKYRLRPRQRAGLFAQQPQKKERPEADE